MCKESNSLRTQRDIDTITADFIENDAEPVHFRAVALINVASWYTSPGSHLNMGIAAEHFRECLNVIASSPKKDEKRQVLHHPLIYFPMSEDPQQHFSSNDLTLKRVLGLCGDKARKFLSRGVLPVPATNKSNATPTSRRKTQLELLHDRYHAGGLMCDGCGKTLEDLQMTSLKRCSRCLMVFYCSPTCQREHWKKKGHNKTCREKGQSEI
jgi:MYND finger